MINYNLQRENKQRISHDYQPNDQVLLTVDDPKKLDCRWEGPYRLVHVHTNGSVTLRVDPHVTERINIRCIKPYRAPAATPA